jgi:dipeptidyl aminopeptidase/acylaminoacyl peptidase
VRLDDEEKFIDPSAPLYLSMYGEWSKKYGYARLQLGKQPEPVVWTDDRVDRLIKAEEADIYAYVTQDFDDAPDYFVAPHDFTRARQVSHTNPFQKEYAWGRSELIEYENPWGRKLQGALFYPAAYEPGKQYPMIVYIYEIRSPSVHQYQAPSERSYYNTTVFTSEGYFVLQPDIIFKARDPGRSSVQTIEAAVEEVLKTGLVDPARVGLVGHSWGGYQAAYAVTQTDIFSAAVAGAPLTNLISMYGAIFWNSGFPEAGHFEIGQERMEVPYWEDPDAYIRNSPVFNVKSLNTPLLVEVGDADGNVDMRQGIEYYNVARRAGKKLVLLAYEGENHGLAKKHNQIDYHRRILTWFGHYLKGEPAPLWISDGVPYLEQDKLRNKE